MILNGNMRINGRRGQAEDWFADLPVGIILIIIGLAILSFMAGSYKEDINVHAAMDMDESLVRASALGMLRTKIDIEGKPEEFKGKRLAELISDISKNYPYFNEKYSWMEEAGLITRNFDYESIGCGTKLYDMLRQLRHDGFAVYTRSWLSDAKNQKPIFVCGQYGEYTQRMLRAGKVNITIPTDVPHNYLIVEYTEVAR
ncbi:hypothetical protein HZB88_01115 [archaeon]|nr:hypothetical protein [archaeon]